MLIPTTSRKVFDGRWVHVGPGTHPFNLRCRSQWRMTMDEKRMARLFGLTLGGLFAISLILNAIAI